MQPSVAQIGCAHNLVIMETRKDSQKREFYTRMTKELAGQLPDPRQIEQILMRMGE